MNTTPRDCPAPLILEAHFDGLLEGQERQSVRRHVKRCAACRAELDRLDRLTKLCRVLPASEADAGLEARILTVLGATPARPVLPWHQRRPLRVAALAAAVFVLAVLAWWLNRDGVDSESLRRTPELAEEPAARATDELVKVEEPEEIEEFPQPPELEDPSEVRPPRLEPRDEARALLVAWSAEDGVDETWRALNELSETHPEIGSATRLLRELGTETGPAAVNALRLFVAHEPSKAGRTVEQVFDESIHPEVALELCLKLTPARARRILSEALTRPELQEIAIRQIGEFGDPEYLSALQEIALERPELGDVIRSAVQQIPGTDSLDVLLELHARGSTNAVPALFSLGEPAFQYLRNRLENRRLEEASLEIELLSRLGDRPTVGLLSERIDRIHQNLTSDERTILAVALSRIGGFEAARTLARFLREDGAYGSSSLDPSLLLSFDSDVAAGLIVQAGESANPFERAALLRLAALIGRGDVVGELFELARGRDRRLHLPAIEALGETGAAQAVGPLGQLLSSTRGDDRRAAIRALARLGDVAAVPRLAELLRRDARLRPEIVEALTSFDSESTIPSLIQALSYRDVRDRAHAGLVTLTGVELPARAKDWERWLAEQPREEH
ncbi:MAG: HEAT repeat domain-containing protein [Planctomycetota bacterium]